MAANGKPVRRVPDLTDQLEQIGVGGKVLLTLKRGNQQSTAELEVIDIGQTAKASERRDVMNKMLVAVLDEQLCCVRRIERPEGSTPEWHVTLYASTVIAKDKTGKIKVKRRQTPDPLAPRSGLSRVA